jgi:Protein of unknown function (DUF3891)
MIIQTAPAGEPRLAVMMHEHTALSGQFARAFGNDHFEPVRPHDLMFFVVSHHDAGWAEFDRDPVTDERTGLPYNLVVLAGEIDRQKKLKAEIAKNPEMADWIEEGHLFQNYKQLQFFDTLALYFNRTHPDQRDKQDYEHVPLNAQQDVRVTIRPREPGVYEVSPYPFAANGAEFSYAGRLIEPHQHQKGSGWPSVLRITPTQWESFRLVAA